MDEVEGTCEACQVFLTHVAMTRLSRISSCWAEADVHVNHSGSRIAEVWAVDEWIDFKPLRELLDSSSSKVVQIIILH